MGKGIKTREVVQNIKVHDSAVNVGDKVKNIGVKSKEAVSENINPTDASSPEQYASDKISDAMRRGVETATVGTEKVVKKGAEKAAGKIKEKIIDKRDNTGFDERNEGKSKKEIKSKEKNSGASDVKEKTQAPPKQREIQASADEIKKPRQRKQTPPKTKGKPSVKKANADKQTIKTLGSEVNRIKQTNRSLHKKNNAIKKANNKVKTAKKTTKAAKSTAKTTAEVAKRTKQAAVATARATVKTVKAAAKAIVAIGKAVVSAVKSIGGIIAAGGAPAVVIIIVIVLIAVIGGTCFGVFLSNDETTGSDMTMTQAISQLTSEHYESISTFKDSYEYDTLEIVSDTGNTSINWKDVLAVYAVKTTTKNDDAMEVVTINELKLDLLREIVKDMNLIFGSVTTREVEETVITQDEEGNDIVSTNMVSKNVLTITITHLSVDEITEVYNFTDEQKDILIELMSEEFDELWDELLGASGQIIQTGSSFVGTGIFAWPFEETHTITSYFGTRSDPFTGETTTHGGTDIAAPLGTPILAAADGVVEIASYGTGGYGFYVKIRHDDTYSTLYGHCSALHVTPGQTVKQGQVIADCGSTGKSTGPHCHFEVIQNGVRVDALMFYEMFF